MLKLKLLIIFLMGTTLALVSCSQPNSNIVNIKRSIKSNISITFNGKTYHDTATDYYVLNGYIDNSGIYYFSDYLQTKRISLNIVTEHLNCSIFGSKRDLITNTGTYTLGTAVQGFDHATFGTFDMTDLVDYIYYTIYPDTTSSHINITDVSSGLMKGTFNVKLMTYDSTIYPATGEFTILQ